MVSDDGRGVQFNDTVTTEVQSICALMAWNLPKTLRSDDRVKAFMTA